MRRSTACILGMAVVASASKAEELERNGHRFTVAPGWSIDVVAGPPLVERPITADFDERGRLYVAESSGSNDPVTQQVEERTHSILRLEDIDGDGQFDRRSLFADRMMFPEGTMWFDGSLYVAAPPQIWKLTDADDDGVAERREVWFDGQTLTGCANDLHGPYLGPDGWIYWCKGAFAEQTYPREGKPPLVTRASHIFRARPDGSGIEPVMTGGMDNPVDVVFTPEGERIFTTTFLVHPGGGQRDGLIHAIYGGVYGKVHDPIFSHPWTGPDTMPVLSHLGPAAPSGLVCLANPRHPFEPTLLACQFNLRRVSRHDLKLDPSGHGCNFQVEESVFLESDQMDFHPTDVIEDADGSVLVVDTGGWYKLCCPTSQLAKPEVTGAIYRLRRDGHERPVDPRGLKIEWTEQSEADLTQLLADPRPAVRRRATETLRKRGKAAIAPLAAALSANPNTDHRLAALWCLAGIDHPDARDAVRIPLAGIGGSVQRAALQSVSLHRDKLARDQVVAILRRGGTLSPTRRLAAEALGRIGDPSVVSDLLSAAGTRPSLIDRTQEHAIRYALIEIADPQSTRAGLSSESPETRLAALVALDQMPNGGIQFGDLASWLVGEGPGLDTALWIASRHPEWGDLMVPTFVAWLDGNRPPGLDETAAASRIARFAGSPGVRDLLAETASRGGDHARRALLSMAASDLDPAPGQWRDAVQSAALIGDPAALDAVRSLRWDEADASGLTQSLVDAASREDRPATERIALLATVPGKGFDLDDDTFSKVVEGLNPQQPVPDRVQACEILAKALLTPSQLARLADSLARVGPLEINRLFPPFEGANDPEVGRRLVAALGQSKALANVRAVDLERLFEPFAASLRSEIDNLLAQLAAGRVEQERRIEALMAGLSAGNVARGREVYNGTKAACRACHAMGYVGGKIGPDLTRIGQIRTERDLLEAIVAPSASFVRSYEPLLVATSDGRVFNGLLKSETADTIVLTVSATEEVRLARADVEETRAGDVSVMPAGLDQQLTPTELADLVTFLKASR